MEESVISHYLLYFDINDQFVSVHDTQILLKETSCSLWLSEISMPSKWTSALNPLIKGKKSPNHRETKYITSAQGILQHASVFFSGMKWASRFGPEHTGQSEGATVCKGQ